MSDTRPTSAADIFFSSSPTLTPTSSADVGVSVGKLDRQCRRPTLADTQADTQSVTLVVLMSQFLARTSCCALGGLHSGTNELIDEDLDMVISLDAKLIMD